MGKRRSVSYLSTSYFQSGGLNYSPPGSVYRYVSTGANEEKIFQQQANKQAVADEEGDTEWHFNSAFVVPSASR
jgi:hypothetical protein